MFYIAVRIHARDKCFWVVGPNLASEMQAQLAKTAVKEIDPYADVHVYSDAEIPFGLCACDPERMD